MSIFKINSTTFLLEKTSSEYKILEDIITKIGTANKVENVESIHIKLSEDAGQIIFKKAEDVVEEVIDMAAGAVGGPVAGAVADKITDAVSDAIEDNPDALGDEGAQTTDGLMETKGLNELI